MPNCQSMVNSTYQPTLLNHSCTLVHKSSITSRDLPKELDVQHKQNKNHHRNDRAVLIDHGLPRQLLGTPLELLGLVDQIPRNFGHIFQFFTSIQHLLDVLLHDALNVGQVLVELGGILSARWVDKLPLLALDVLIELDELVRSTGGIDGPTPIVAVIAGQLFEEPVGYFFQIHEGQPFRIGGLGEGEVADHILDEVVKYLGPRRFDGHTHGLSGRGPCKGALG